jgi:hypothetical protein
LPALPAPPVTLPKKTNGIRVWSPSRSGAVVGDELADAYMPWDDISAEEIDAYRAVLETANGENPLQKHLALRPILLVQRLGGGHGRWVLSKSGWAPNTSPTS